MLREPPLESQADLDPFEYVRYVATARIALPKTYVRLTSGRRQISPETHALCFFAGANSVHFATEKMLATPNQKKEKMRICFKNSISRHYPWTHCVLKRI